MKARIFKFLLLIVPLLIFNGCYEQETIYKEAKSVEPSTDSVDQFIQASFLNEYGVAVRYKYVDRYVSPDKRVTPPRLEVVKPMLNFLTEFWIEPYLNVENGESFFKNHVPAEVILIGSSMYNADGTVTLGTADAGARITLTEVNDVDIDNINWVFRQLGTIYHEFAHIIHQRYNLPPNFQQISPEGYSSAGSWFNISEEEALRRGFVSPYGTSSFNEDYAEIVAYVMYYPEFYETFIDLEEDCDTPDCIERNEGREKIRKKLNLILNHYEQNTGVDLLEVRKLIQEKY